MAGISIREFARRDGCNDKLVRRAITQGKLKTLANGLLDEKLVGTGWRKNNRRNAPTEAPKPDADKPADTVRTPEPPLEPTVTSLKEWLDRILAGDFVPLFEAEKVKENALALKHLLDGRQKAGELVDAQIAQNVLFEQARAFRDILLNWPAKIGPLLAADLGLDAERVVEALTRYVHQLLGELGEPDADFSG